MSVADVRTLLGFAALANYVVLTVWFIAFCTARARLYRLHARWFRLSEPTFDAIHYAGMAIYKILVLVFALVPYVVLAWRDG